MFGMFLYIVMMAGASLERDDSGGGDGGFMAAVLEFTGCLDEADLDAQEAERLSEYYRNPLPLNYASRSRLLASGLLSAYQTAVLIDCRTLSGDILSYEELSALDGFGHDFVSVLRPFVSLASSSAPGVPSSSPPVMRNAATFNSGIRSAGDASPEGNWSMKYRISAGESFEAGLSMRSSYQAEHFPPEKFSFFAAWYARRFPGKVVIGDYRLRFGQGLALWPGFSMSGVSSPEAFARRPSGISPYNSYSGEGAFRGLAADFGGKHFNISLFAAMPGIRTWMEDIRPAQLKDPFRPDVIYGANAGWYGMSGQVSFTCFAMSSFMQDDMDESVDPLLSHRISCAKCSADARFSIKGADLFSEVAYDIQEGCIAALAGAGLAVSDGVRAAVLLRYYPPGYTPEYSGAVRSGSKCTNEYGASIAVSHSSGNRVVIAGKTGFGSSEKRFSGVFSADASYSPEPKYGVDTSSFQFKAVISETVRISPFFSASVRLSERYRTYGRPLRTDARADLMCGFSRWCCNLRINVLHCAGFSFLSYVEAGYRSPGLSIWLRTGVFRADSWDDRIYAYERDAPGNFSVPAYYGRGYWAALTAGWKFARGFRLYLRGAFTDYPWTVSGSAVKKPAKAELKLQLAVDLFTRCQKRGVATLSAAS